MCEQRHKRPLRLRNLVETAHAYIAPDSEPNSEPNIEHCQLRRR